MGEMRDRANQMPDRPSTDRPSVDRPSPDRPENYDPGSANDRRAIWAAMDRATKDPAFALSPEQEKDLKLSWAMTQPEAAGYEPPDKTSAPRPHEADGGIDRERPDELAKRRANELQEQLPEGARGRVTMAVGITEATGGEQTTVVGTSEPRGYLRPGVTLNEGEVIAPGRGHAEADIVHWAEQREHKVLTVGAGRPICPPCAEHIRRVDAEPATPLKEDP